MSASTRMRFKINKQTIKHNGYYFLHRLSIIAKTPYYQQAPPYKKCTVDLEMLVCFCWGLLYFFIPKNSIYFLHEVWVMYIIKDLNISLFITTSSKAIKLWEDRGSGGKQGWQLGAKSSPGGIMPHISSLFFESFVPLPRLSYFCSISRQWHEVASSVTSTLVMSRRGLPYFPSFDFSL